MKGKDGGGEEEIRRRPRAVKVKKGPELEDSVYPFRVIRRQAHQAPYMSAAIEEQSVGRAQSESQQCLGSHIY